METDPDKQKALLKECPKGYLKGISQARKRTGDGMKKRISLETAALVLLLGLMLTSSHAQAAIGNADVLDDMLTRYQTAASAWATIITERASWLFWYS
jgi:hypothetical protein